MPTTSAERLVLTTLSAVGLPVEAQANDGSIYSGILHSASFDKGFEIVLKDASLIFRGGFSNLDLGIVVDTLVVPSDSLVQVIVKDFSFPTEGVIDSSLSDRLRKGVKPADSRGTSAISWNIDDNKENTRPIKFSGGADIRETRHFKKILQSLDNDHNDLGKKDGCLYREEVAEQSHRPEVSISEGRVGDSGVHAEANMISYNDMDSSTNKVACEAHDFSSFSMKSGSGDSGDVCPSTRPSSSVSSDGNSTISTLSTSPNLPSSEGNPFCNTCTKEFKLNPEAKVFWPSFTSGRSISAVVPPIVNTSYLSRVPTALPLVAAQSNFEISSFPTCTPPPAKVLQHNPLVVAGQTGISTHYSQPISGQVNTRQQPARFIGQYHPTIQTGTSYMHQNTQPVMVGRASQIVYVHPISPDPIQGTAILSQGLPLLTPSQANIPKIQGAHAQSLQFCVPPSLVTAASVQSFPIPSPIPFSSTVPVIRPITVPGGNGFFGSKFQ